MPMEIDIVTFLLQPIALVVCAVVAYVYLFREKRGRKNGHYTNPDWNFSIKKWWAVLQARHQRQRPRRPDDGERARVLQREESADSMSMYGADQRGTSVFLKYTRRRHRVAEVWLVVRLPGGVLLQLPNHPDTVIANNNSQGWSAAGLRLSVLEPYRKWRVTFNGLLRRGAARTWGDDTAPVVHVRFNLIWTAASTPMYWPNDWSPHLLADALAREPWKDGNWINMISKHPTGGYDQFGCLSGMIDVTGGSCVTVSLPGVRSRRWGPHKAVCMYRTVSFVGIFADGNIFLVEANSALRGLTHYISGIVRFANGEIHPIDDSNLHLPDIAEDRTDVPKTYPLRFIAGGVPYAIMLDLRIENTVRLFGGRPWEWEASLVPLVCSLAGTQAVGLAQLWYPYYGECPVKATPRMRHLVATYALPSSRPLVLDLREHSARCVSLVGGKAASLALLGSAQDDDYSVPDGLCLTVDALEMQLRDREKLREAVERVARVSCGKEDADLEDVCNKAVVLLQSTDLPEGLRQTFLCALGDLRGRLDDPRVRFAVRSSAVGEDSEELSAAGQCESVLGCATDDDIEHAVKQCWASLYSYRSVHYRRHYGQPINCGMGVVVQVMVPAEKAGVMFTRYPVSGDPSQIYITANYGLGVSVSSAHVEPDTLIVRRDWHDRLRFGEAIRGRKSHAVLMRTADEPAGTETRPLTAAERDSPACLTEPEALRLAELAVRLESLYGAPRDVEWAMCDKGVIHLLQARPMTAATRFSDWELLHELDTPAMTSDEVTAFGGAAEAFPGVATPLTLSAILPRLDRPLVVLRLGRAAAKTLHAMVVSHHRVASNFMTQLMADTQGVDYAKRVAIQSAICGTRTTNRTKCKSKQVVSNDKADRLRCLLDVVKSTWNVKKHVQDLQDFLDGFDMDQERCETALELYQKISDDLPHLGYVAMLHYRCSAVSVISHVIAMLILTEKNKELRAEHLHDASILLSACSDPSGSAGGSAGAAVAGTLRDMAADIRSDGLEHEFRKIPEKEARGWLRERCPRAADRLDAFLFKHGHRALRELDLYAETWGLKPEALFVALKASLAVPVIKSPAEGFKHPQPVADVIANLKSPKRKITRVLLERIVPFCRKSVSRREATKAATVSVIHSFRLAYRRLAEMMRREGLLPEPELIFFMSHTEIGKLLETRNATVLSKAWRRKRLFPQWEAMRFTPFRCRSALSNGLADSKAVSVRGTTVSEGSAKGRACVLDTFDEVHNLKQGDILITLSTDVGWSPYFPMLAGVVTELGGLISHGALVAREFGLPCIVGAHGATELFSTGDFVQIDATTGTLLKLL